MGKPAPCKDCGGEWSIYGLPTHNSPGYFDHLCIGLRRVFLTATTDEHLAEMDAARGASQANAAAYLAGGRNNG